MHQMSQAHREHKLKKYVEVVRLHVTNSVVEYVLLHWPTVACWNSD